MTKNLTILILLTLLTGCSTVRQAVTKETKKEVIEIKVPKITASKIPGIYSKEISLDSMHTGEVIKGEIKDSIGNIIAEIKYRPLKKKNIKTNDTAGTFSAIIKPAPVKTEVKTETTEITNTKEISFYDKLLILVGIVVLLMIIKLLK